MKKLSAILLTIVMAFTMVACSGGGKDTDKYLEIAETWSDSYFAENPAMVDGELVSDFPIIYVLDIGDGDFEDKEYMVVSVEIAGVEFDAYFFPDSYSKKIEFTDFTMDISYKDGGIEVSVDNTAYAIINNTYYPLEYWLDNEE